MCRTSPLRNQPCHCVHGVPIQEVSNRPASGRGPPGKSPNRSQHRKQVLPARILCDGFPFNPCLRLTHVHVKVNSFLGCGLAMADEGPAREAFSCSHQLLLRARSSAASAVRGRARHMVATAGEQGGHADIMRPFESLNSITKENVLRQEGHYI